MSPRRQCGIRHSSVLTVQRFSVLSAFALVLLIAGCASPRQKPPPQRLTGDPVTDGQAAIENGPEKDKVLWQYRTALAFIRQGKFEEAKPLLDDAITRISNVLGKDESARKARGYFSPEAKKNFIGEPYERAMAYYYRGVLYWMDGEPDNARACFRSAAFEDSDTVDKTYAADYVLLDYLDGLVSAKLGGDGADGFKRATEAAKLSSPPPYNPKANVLFFVDYGPPPIKYAMGEYGQELMFRTGHTPIRGVQIQVDGKTFKLRPWDDLYFQATTRGGRMMDRILANKAGFKRTTDAAGTAGIIGGAVMTQHRETQVAGLGLLAAGLLSKIASASTTPQADIRTRDNLPHYLSFAGVELPPGEYNATVDFLDGADRILPNLTKKLAFTVPPGNGDKVIYVSEKSVTPQNL
jgi:tetratricopeptide (TPR) repeat protein